MITLDLGVHMVEVVAAAAAVVVDEEVEVVRGLSLTNPRSLHMWVICPLELSKEISS